ncbi:hypothetical protein BKA83DRAFT_686360 [Pisolithus microcarpus]|nr:hypothetical protein BKA83DRAFT_686360 [Pisolithus microcarpus]
MRKSAWSTDCGAENLLRNVDGREEYHDIRVLLRTMEPQELEKKKLGRDGLRKQIIVSPEWFLIYFISTRLFRIRGVH